MARATRPRPKGSYLQGFRCRIGRSLTRSLAVPHGRHMWTAEKSRLLKKYLLAIRCSDPIKNQNGWKRWYNLVINANCLKTRFSSSFWKWCTARTNLHTKLVLKIVELPVLLKVLPKQSLKLSWILLYMQPLSPVSRYECKGSMASHGHSLPYSICGSTSHNVCSYFTQLISFQIAFKFKTGWCFQPSWKICS